MTSAMIRKRNESGFTLIELMMVVAILGGLAATAIPAFMRYVRRAHTVEALMNLKRLSDSALVYYEAEHADVHGNILARQFPVGLSGWMPTPMPSQICQFPGHKGPARWANDVFESLAEFHTLNFTMDDDIYFGYQIQSTDQLQVATGDTSTVGKPGYTAQVDAWGDQNCNGTWSHFWRTLTVDQNGAIRGGSAILDFQPLE